MKLIAFGIFLVLVVSVFAIHNGNGGYAGINSELGRQNDPYNRNRYFGPSYQSPFGGQGLEGASRQNFGAQGVTSSRSNLDTNAFTPGGRNPKLVSRVDPNFRGYAKIDVAVPLEATELVLVEEEARRPKGLARVVSKGDLFGTTWAMDALSFSEVNMRTSNLPPVGDYQIYQGWLVDEDNNYAMSLGFLRSGIDMTGKLRFLISRSFVPFEAVMVTLEPFPDEDPRPGQKVLYGKFKSRTVLAPYGSQAKEAVR